jgi:RimJ/RimL family protein N-acetyltransferase
VILAPIDLAGRDAVRRGELSELGTFTASPGWPHEDTEPGLSFLDSGGTAFLIVDDDGRIIGECGTKTPPDEDGMVEIGYGLAAPSRGRGLGTAAVGILIATISDRSDVRMISAEVHVGNDASWRVLERHGFTAIGAPTNGYRRYQRPALGHLEQPPG